MNKHTKIKNQNIKNVIQIHKMKNKTHQENFESMRQLNISLFHCLLSGGP